MGRYFGIANRTKNHKVSSGDECWKGFEWCNCHSVMHRYHWDVTDDIYSACYDTYTGFKYDADNNSMETYDPELERMANDMKDKCVKEEKQLRHNIKLLLENPDKLKKLVGYGLRLNIEYLYYTPEFAYETIKSFLENADKIPTEEYTSKLGHLIHRRLSEVNFFETTFTTYVMNHSDENSTYSKNMAFILKEYQVDKQDGRFMYSEGLPHYNINQIIEACTYYGFSDQYHDAEGYLIVSDDEDSDDAISDEEQEKKAEKQIDISIKLGFYPEENITKQFNFDHAPKWDGDICKVCQYKFDKSHIDKDSTKFDSAFFMG